jgi:hypothetical protein
MMPESKKIAAELVEQEAKRAVEFLEKLNIPVQIASADTSGWPEGDGEGMLAPITIGTRGHLTKHKARKNAAMWREARQRYPKATLLIHMLGFDEDPRQICEVPEAVRFVRWWARYAGMDDGQEAERYIADAVDDSATRNVAFLAACGVYGDELKARALRNMPSPIKAN